MNKASLIASAALVGIVLAAMPAYAQGPFADVPSDHWAYQAVDKLQKAGIVIGYPDQTYGGKRSMTRYEFAIAISRLLDKITAAPPLPADLVHKGDLDAYALKTDLDKYALKSDLAGFARKEDVDTLRRLIDEFRSELVAVGVDLDAVKKRLDDLEKRVKAIEDELKRVRIEGSVNVYGRGNHRSGNHSSVVGGVTIPATSVRDANGFEVTGGPASKGNLLADTRVFHDVDVDIKARLSDKATAETVLNFGNYLPFLGSVASFTGARSDRAAFGGYSAMQVSQMEDFTVWKASIDASIAPPILGRTGVSVGRIPLQLGDYTLKLLDVDYYFDNTKTDSGDVPVDGVKARFNLGPVRITGYAAKVDPIKFVSNANGDMADQGVYGLYAGAGRSPFATGGTILPGQSGIPGGLSVANGVGRPFGSLINPGNNGAMSVEQLGGARAELSFSRIGTLGATYLALSGKSAVAPQSLIGLTGVNRDIVDQLSFNRVFVYSADVTTNILFGIGITGVYSKTDTGGERLNADGSIATKTENKITGDDYAYDVSASKGFGALGLKAGYRYVSPFFAAPGYWTRVGSWYNPVDIKGPYGDVTLKLGKRIHLIGGGQWYEGTDKAPQRGGLTQDDKVRNYKAGLNFSTTTLSRVDLGWEQTEYEVIPFGGGSRVKPREIWWNLGYGYSFNPNNSVRFGYQYIDYDDKNSGFDPTVSKGGVGTVEFRVKF
jgi:polyhydroxyalkanoate synthesis regulator phasin